jgi:hypothetical protein
LRAEQPVVHPANGGVADVLPDEPGGYTDFNALFGHKYVVPAISGGNGTLTDLLGNPIPGLLATLRGHRRSQIAGNGLRARAERRDES